jgi:hypothetical protein
MRPVGEIRSAASGPSTVQIGLITPGHGLAVGGHPSGQIREIGGQVDREMSSRLQLSLEVVTDNVLIDVSRLTKELLIQRIIGTPGSFCLGNVIGREL